MEAVALAILCALVVALIVYGVSLYLKGPLIPDDDEVYGDDDQTK